MDITVAICTWNRASLLDQTLARMGEMHIPQGIEWELLVVDNNCTDHTQEVVKQHTERLPLRGLQETKQGLSNARNCAVDSACGELLVWTDDDIQVDLGWLAAYARGMQEEPEASFFGGPIIPWFPNTPPGWFLKILPRVATAYGMRDFGEQTMAYTDKKCPFGGNYAIRTAVQRRYRYDPNLGVKGGGRLGGEETAVARQMLADGLHGQYLPDAQVKHYVPVEHQTLKFLRRHYYCQGVVLSKYHKRPNSATLFGHPRWLWRAWLESELKYRLGRLTASPEVWIEHLISASKLRGELSVGKEEIA